jgi:hypothetical protein
VRLARLSRSRGEGDPLEGARRGALLELEGEPAPGVTLRSDKVGVSRRR